MKKIILATSALAFSVIMHAQTEGRSTVPPAQQTGSVTPQPAPRQTRPKENAPVSNPPPVKPAPMIGNPKPEEGHDNGQHKDHGKHNGEFKHDHDKHDHEHKDSLKIKKKED